MNNLTWTKHNSYNSSFFLNNEQYNSSIKQYNFNNYNILMLSAHHIHNNLKTFNLTNLNQSPYKILNIITHGFSQYISQNLDFDCIIIPALFIHHNSNKRIKIYLKLLHKIQITYNIHHKYLTFNNSNGNFLIIYQNNINIDSFITKFLLTI
jgi:hypothetical protein